MASERPSSWLNEVGNTPPRKPSISGVSQNGQNRPDSKIIEVKGPLVPFDLSVPSTPKSARSQSFPEGPLSPETRSRAFSPALWPVQSLQQHSNGLNPARRSFNPWNPPHTQGQGALPRASFQTPPLPEDEEVIARHFQSRSLALNHYVSLNFSC